MMIYDACIFLPNEWPQNGSIFDHSRFKCHFHESNQWSGSGQIAIFETAGPHVHLEYIIACSSMFFHVLPLVLKWATDEITCLVLKTKLQQEKAAGSTFSTSLQMSFIQAIEWQQSDCQFRNSRSTFFACIKHAHIESSYNMLSPRVCQIMSVHVQSSHGWNFETWPWWTHTSSAALTHWLKSISGIALLASSGQKSSDNTPQATQYLHPTCFQCFISCWH